MEDHGVIAAHVGDRGADLADPPGVLVTERVRQGDVALLRPLALDDVQVGPTQPGPADLDDDVQGAGDARFGHIVEDRLLLVCVEPDRFHSRTSRR